MALLDIRNLSVDFTTASGAFRAVDGVDLTVDNGEIVAIVGESGSGKSVSMLALMGLLPWTATITADLLQFQGQDLRKLTPKARRKIIGKDIAMIFQEPMSSLNPCFTVGFQIKESLRLHMGMDRAARHKRAIELLDLVGIPAPESRLSTFPHQMSGGMNQRVMIAMAIACNPKLLIADEPTTALDVTIQAQILDLLRSLQKERGMALVLITHNMGVVSEMAQRVAVMYAGQIMEERGATDLFATPQHPYTEALMAALPERSDGLRRLATIPGMVPGLYDRPNGCLFGPRCSYAADHCRAQRPALRSWHQGMVRCHYPLGDAAARAAQTEGDLDEVGT